MSTNQSCLSGRDALLSGPSGKGHGTFKHRLMMGQALSNSSEPKPISSMLEHILNHAPPDYFTLEWLIGILHQNSFFILIFFLGLVAMLPVGSTVPGLVLAVLSLQMVGGGREPVLPRFITRRPLPTRYLLWLGQNALPVLKWLERSVFPRWPATFHAIRPITGAIILILTGAILLTPVPLSNVAPAAVIAVIALAYVEEDGLLLSVAILAAFFLICVASATVWVTIVGTDAIMTDLTEH
jgi:hypothetical protein